MEIRLGGLDDPAVIRLLEEHLQSMAMHSPPESIHALDLAGLKRPEITFWSAWEEGELLGCAALKELEARHGEIKSMRTAAAHLRKGVARRLLVYIILEARRRGYERLSLETGSMDAFAAARQLYARFGFEPCEPFAEYVLDPYSVFMTREV
jgi:putative acetyltransferase